MKDIAFALRVDEKEAQFVLDSLVSKGFVDRRKQRYFMHEWGDWNPDSDSRETPGRRRGSAAVAPHNRRGSAAVAPPRVEEDTDKRRVEEEEKPLTRRNIFVLYDNYMGKPSVTATMRDVLIQAEEDYPDECITHCFLAAARSSDGRRSWSYVESILKRHQAEGCSERKPVGRNGGAAPQAGDLAADAAAIYANLGIRNLPVFIAPGGGADAGLATVDGDDDSPGVEDG